ncbi:hypothetical protein [Woodsholea maritima]|uniref:hypothetical protein n=1 Tax=Woodsholea maritima TaxID=240237 RepID=UPI00035C7178|nr:hypothetical protein [Woodsholea maritima]
MSDTSSKPTCHIDWALTGKNDPLMGNGATRAEQALTMISAALLTGLVCYIWWRDSPHHGLWQGALILFLAFDLCGGVIANFLNSCKRYYHAPAQPGEGRIGRAFKHSFVFTLCHIHPIIAAGLLGAGWQVGLIWYVALQLACLSVLAVPLYLRRPLAAGLCLFAIIIAHSFLPLGPGLSWFIPCLFLKLILGHAVREEPYRPTPKDL